MKIIESEKCKCDKPGLRAKFPRGCCSLNQIIICHGDLPVDVLFKHIKIDNKEE